MSLLMDALRKAEEAKRLTGENTTPDASPELTLAPMTPAAARPASPLPDRAPHSDSLDAELSAAASDAPLKRRAPAAASSPSDTGQREAAERSAARNVFAAKTPPRSRLWLVLSLLAIAALGIGAYFWWQLHSLSSAAPHVQARVQAPAPAAPATASSAPLAPAPGQAQSAPPLPQTLSPPPAAARPAPAASALFEARARVERPSPAASQTAPGSPVRLSRSQARPDQTIERAYAAWQAGRFDEAQRDYEQVLRNDGNNTDALLGLAALAARQGQLELAQGYYLRALEADPSNATAQAGLINTRGQADPGLSESRLKGALASQPESSALHFALGNLYSRQSRWSEAQQAYFRAYSGEPDNADFIFNLAVSLDHLHQNRLAAEYYQRALNAERADESSHDNSRRSSFDRNQARKRILELQP
jgi:tetratricopeptide (TPR) repeat protein